MEKSNRSSNYGCMSIAGSGDQHPLGATMDSTALLTALAISLCLTIVFEAVFFFIVGKRDKKDLLLLVLVNTLTNPIVVLFYWLAYAYTNWNVILVIIPLEVFAIVTEGFIYKKNARSIKRPFLFSLAANAFSYTLGLLLQTFVF